MTQSPEYEEVDTPAGARSVLATVSGDPVPSEAHCIAWMTARRQPGHLMAHVTRVRDVAVKLARALNEKGMNLDADLIQAGALLHDIAKGLPRHEAAGSAMARAKGYVRTAALIAQHAEIIRDAGSKLDEAAVVFLADRMVSGSDLVGVEERFRRWRERRKDDPDMLGKLEVRYRMAKAALADVEKALGRPALDVARE